MMKKLKRQIITLIIGLAIIFILLCIAFMLTDWKAYALDRCKDYVTDIRIQHTKYFGLSFPWWYGVGQAKQESYCRPSITSFDAGMGLTQFMPATWKEVESQMGAKLNPYNPEHSIKAQAFYMHRLHKQNWDGALWLTYCFYNSGAATMKKEWKKTECSMCHKEAFYDEMKAVCKRKVIKLKSGRLLDLCEVGYDYPKKVFIFGCEYTISKDQWSFW